MPDLNVTTALSFAQISSSSWGGTVLYITLFGLIPLFIMGILIAVLYNLASYTRFKKVFPWLGQTFVWALTGLLTFGVLAIPMGLVYWGYNQAKAGNTVPLRWVGYIVGGYVVLSFIGWIVQKYVIKRIQGFEKQLNKGKKIKEMPVY